MPHINRIRVNNVKYNFGTQFYDDFVMRFDCRNVLYDLANGGGKSVLLLLLMQNLSPNCTLDEKQPLEKLFRGSDGSTVIHSLIEWKLDDHLIRDGYKYMLTGFCARKAKNDEEANPTGESASIEYFNYVIFYRTYNDNDLVNLPLKNGNQRVTYPGLKNYLKNLARQDYSLDIHIFERKGEYLRFISRFGLYESEWEIIRGINKTEGHVRTYFETHYRSTRKVVEDLLIEGIIQKAFALRTGDGDGGDGETGVMADTLYEIKDQLSDLAKRKDEIHHYDRQSQVLESLAQRVETLDQLYADRDALAEDMVKTFNSAAFLGRTREKELAVAEREKEMALDKVTDLSRRLETAKIQSGRQRLLDLSEMIADKQKEIGQLKEEIESLRGEIALKRSVNDYLDHAAEKEQLMAVNEAIRHGDESRQSLAAKLSLYACEYQGRYEAKAAALDSLFLKEKQAIHLTEADLTEQDAHEREMDRIMAILEHDLQQASAEEKQLMRSYAILRDEAGLLIAEDAGKLYKDARKQLKALETEADLKAENLAYLQEQALQMQLRREQIPGETEKVREEIGRLEAFMAGWKNQYEQLSRLMKIYKAEGIPALRDKMMQGCRTQLLTANASENRIALLQAKLRQLNEGNPLVPGEDALRLMDYIRTCHDLTCIYGAEYLNDLSEDDRKAVLLRLPMLPYTIIVKEGFSRLCQDVLLEEKDFGEYVIPVMGMETILGENQPVDQAHVLFAGKGQSFYLDDNRIAREILALEDELAAEKKKLTRLQDQIRTFEEDLRALDGFVLVYDQRKSEKERRLEEAKVREALLIKEQKDLGLSKQSLEAQILAAQDEVASIKKQIGECSARSETLLELTNVSRQLDQLSSDQSDLKVRLKTAKTDKDAASVELKNLERRLKEMRASAAAHLQQKDELVKDWQENWQVYAQLKVMPDGADGDGAVIGDVAGGAGNEGCPVDVNEAEQIREMDDDRLVAAFAGAKAVYEKAFTDLTDKNRLAESCLRSMQRLAGAISDRGYSLDELGAMEKKGPLIRSDEEALSALKDRLENQGRMMSAMSETLTILEAEKNKLHGSVDQAVDAAVDRFGAFKEVDMHNQSIEDYTRSINGLLKETKEKLSASEKRIDRLTKECYFLEGLHRDLERMLTVNKIQANLTNQTYPADMNLKKKFEELGERHEKMQMAFFAKREAFEKDKAKAVSSLKLLGAQALAEELDIQVTLPVEAKEAKRLMESIRETVSLIGLEKERTLKNMDNLLAVKETFENQCLQVCLNIKTELDKLSKMSAITMDGERIQMIGLSVPYIKENLYREHMSAYIDDIVAGLDRLGSQEEKMHLIRTRLEWKRLFAVIVTDMQAIKLMLYKRERIKEQSRYLRYEEAVGSTGQSQGIYIQFLIAVIHYISSLNAGGAAAESTKKVIFIDNPFGAAKDIYIWEPIFALLKANNVQLVVPARGTTPAITGRFDVNYVLGQQLVGGKNQTIVVDFHSHVDVEELNYVKIDYEQQVFDFV